MGSNARFSYKKGKQARLAAELAAHQQQSCAPSVPPFFSHDATLQSQFAKGWLSITACDIRLHLGIDKPEYGADLVTKIRRFKECHLQPSRR